MERNHSLDRRTVVRGAGVLAAGVLAGCSGGSGSGGDSSGGGSSETDSDGSSSDGDSGGEKTGTEGSGSETETETAGGGGTPATETGGSTATDAGTATRTEAGTPSTTGGGTGGASAQVDAWLADANGYDGSIANKTGSDTVEIAVGAGESGYAFDPAAVRVSPGTTIRWAWTGEGYAHNVVSKDGTFDSGQPESGEDVAYEKTLGESGTHAYYCEPHRRLGMKGAVVVGEA